MTTNQLKRVRTFRHENVRVHVWRQRGESGVFYWLSVQRRESARQQWGAHTRFERHDVMPLATAANDAHSWLYIHGRDERRVPIDVTRFRKWRP